MDWLNIVIQGALLGGLYALFAVGLSLFFGIMRIVNIAHGDLIVLAAYVALVAVDATGIYPIASLVVVVPVMFVLGYALQRGLLNFTLGAGSCRRCWSPSASPSSSRTCCCRFSAPHRRLQAGAIETASFKLGGDRCRRLSAAGVRDGVRVDRGACSCCSIARRSAAPSAPPPTMPTRPS